MLIEEKRTYAPVPFKASLALALMSDGATAVCDLGAVVVVGMFDFSSGNC